MDLTQADDDDFNRSIGRFEAALTAREPDIPEPGVRRLLLAVDGSNQDSTARKLAELLARGRQAPVSVLFAYEGPANPSREDHTNRVVAELQDAGVQARAVPRAPEADPRRSYDRILAAVAEQECDLVVVPAPYLDDFTELGRDSVGTNLDLLMARSSVPLLVVREPNDDPAECFDQVLLPITPYEPPIVPAASWALHLARGLRIVAVVDRAMIESAGTLL